MVGKVSGVSRCQFTEAKKGGKFIVLKATSLFESESAAVKYGTVAPWQADPNFQYSDLEYRMASPPSLFHCFSSIIVLRSSPKVGGVGFMQKRNDALFDASKLTEAQEPRVSGSLTNCTLMDLQVVTSQKTLPDKAQSRA